MNNANGIIIRYGARTVARANFHEDDKNYCQLYAPVTCTKNIQTALSVCVLRDLEAEYVDIKGVFFVTFLPKGASIVVKLPNINGVHGADGQYMLLVYSMYDLEPASRP